MADNIVRLCMITDDKYSIFTGIALTSLKSVKATDFEYEIYILVNQVSQNNMDRLKQLDGEGFKIIIKAVSGLEEYEEKFKNANISATPTSLYKFLIPELFPEFDKMLYVDGDVLFYKDIADLYSTDISNCYGAVTPEAYGTKEEPPFNCKRIKSNNTVYFNSGFMLLNLKKLREENIPERLMDYKLNGINVLMDQDAFNVVFNENIHILHPSVFPPYYDIENKQLNPIYECDSKKVLLKKLYVLHLASKRKPWVTRMPYITKRYMSFHKQSPFSDFELKPIGYAQQAFNNIYDKLYGTAVYKFIHKMKNKA